MQSIQLRRCKSRGGVQTGDCAILPSLPETLLSKCKRLIDGFHKHHGHVSLPDILWKLDLGELIERNDELRQMLKSASTARSGKTSNEGFKLIAACIFSLEILACDFAGWGAVFPDSGEIARKILYGRTSSVRMPLMNLYLHPPKRDNSASIASLALPVSSSDVRNRV